MSSFCLVLKLEKENRSFRSENKDINGKSLYSGLFVIRDVNMSTIDLQTLHRTQRVVSLSISLNYLPNSSHRPLHPSFFIRPNANPMHPLPYALFDASSLKSPIILSTASISPASVSPTTTPHLPNSPTNTSIAA